MIRDVVLTRRLEQNGTVVGSAVLVIADARLLIPKAGRRRLRFSFFANEPSGISNQEAGVRYVMRRICPVACFLMTDS